MDILLLVTLSSFPNFMKLCIKFLSHASSDTFGLMIHIQAFYYELKQVLYMLLYHLLSVLFSNAVI